jgi:hypothetical protein
MLHILHELRWAAPGLAPGDRARLSALTDRFRTVAYAHGPAYREKLRRELKSHLDSWEWFLDECERREATCREDYESEVWLRTRIFEIVSHAADSGIDIGDAGDRLAALDARLRAVFRDGDYVGPAGGAAAYPPETHWWLHGRPLPNG